MAQSGIIVLLFHLFQAVRSLNTLFDFGQKSSYYFIYILVFQFIIFSGIKLVIKAAIQPDIFKSPYYQQRYDPKLSQNCLAKLVP